MTTGENKVALNWALGVLSLVCCIGGATGLIPIWEQWQRITAYTEVLQAEGEDSPNLPERPNPKEPGPAIMLVFFAEVAALIMGGNVVFRLAGREKDGLVNRSGMWIGAAGFLGACLVFLALFIAALAFAWVGITTWW